MCIYQVEICKSTYHWNSLQTCYFFKERKNNKKVGRTSTYLQLFISPLEAELTQIRVSFYRSHCEKEKKKPGNSENNFRNWCVDTHSTHLLLLQAGLSALPYLTNLLFVYRNTVYYGIFNLKTHLKRCWAYIISTPNHNKNIIRSSLKLTIPVLSYKNS